jgi:hypothetical protein
MNSTSNENVAEGNTDCDVTVETAREVAYFSMEIGIDANIPTYSGGLGLLAMVFGLMEIITAVGIRETFSSKWSLMVGGILSALVGVFLLVHPFLSAAVMMSLVGFLTIIVGLVRMVLALRLRVVKEHV